MNCFRGFFRLSREEKCKEVKQRKKRTKHSKKKTNCLEFSAVPRMLLLVLKPIERVDLSETAN